jgi:hypothetical protein
LRCTFIALSLLGKLGAKDGFFEFGSHDCDLRWMLAYGRRRVFKRQHSEKRKYAISVGTNIAQPAKTGNMLRVASSRAIEAVGCRRGLAVGKRRAGLWTSLIDGRATPLGGAAWPDFDSR